MIKIICLGKIKEKYLTELINDYKKRISKYKKIEIIEIKEDKTIEHEANTISKYIDSKDFVIACCIEGQEMSSEELAIKMEKSLINHSNITFIIGSSLGLSNKIKNIANLKLSFSRFTMPHGLFRGVLLEQIYRACKINNNESYHK